MSVGFTVRDIDHCKAIDDYLTNEYHNCSKQYKKSWSLEALWAQNNSHLVASDLNRWIDRMIPHWPYPAHISIETNDEKFKFIEEACRNILSGVNNMPKFTDEEKELQYNQTLLQNNRRMNDSTSTVTASEYFRLEKELDEYKKKCELMNQMNQHNDRINAENTSLITQLEHKNSSLREHNSLLLKCVQQLLHKNQELEQDKQNILQLNTLYPMYINGENDINYQFESFVEDDEVNDSSQNELYSGVPSDWEHDHEELNIMHTNVDSHLCGDGNIQAVEATVVGFDECGNVYCKRMQKAAQHNAVVCVYLSNSDSLTSTVEIQAADSVVDATTRNIYHLHGSIRTAISSFNVVIPSFRLVFPLQLSCTDICYLDNLSMIRNVSVTDVIKMYSVNQTALLPFIFLQDEHSLERPRSNTERNAHIILTKEQTLFRTRMEDCISEWKKKTEINYLKSLSPERRAQLIFGFTRYVCKTFEEIFCLCGQYVGYLAYNKAERWKPCDISGFAGRNIYASPEFISQLNELIVEQFSNNQALYYFVNHNVALQYIDGQLYLFRNNNYKPDPIGIVHSDLHCSCNSNLLLYLIFKPNNIRGGLPFIFSSAMNATEIYNEYGISKDQLPASSRLMRLFKLATDTIINLPVPQSLIDSIKITKLMQLTSKCKNKKLRCGVIVRIGNTEFVKLCKQSIFNCNNQKTEPVIGLIIEKRKHWLVKMIPIWVPYEQIFCGALSFRYNKQINKWKCSSLCLDKRDIENKCKFYDPTKDSPCAIFLKVGPLRICKVIVLDTRDKENDANTGDKCVNCFQKNKIITHMQQKQTQSKQDITNLREKLQEKNDIIKRLRNRFRNRQQKQYQS